MSIKQMMPQRRIVRCAINERIVVNGWMRNQSGAAVYLQ